jgi:hypothetical protein
MKPKRESLLWQVLSGTELTWVTSALFLVLCAVSVLLRQEGVGPGSAGRTYPPEVLYFLRQAGLSNGPFSG